MKKRLGGGAVFSIVTLHCRRTGQPMREKVIKLRDAFGVGREIPLNYVERPEVDGKFVESLTRDKHVVIYGSSKQGKTTLRKHCLEETDYIVISCLNSMSLDDLHGAILKAAGYRIEQTKTKTVGGKWKYGAEFKGEGKVPFLAKAGSKASIDKKTSNDIEIQSVKLELDLFDVNDIVSALKEINFGKFIILEDFHYLPIETQKSFAFALKTFHESSNLCFIVVGVWREKNRLIYYNGDLTNRVVSIDVDVWSEAHLKEVVQAGEQLLNIKFNDNIIDEIIRHSFDGVSLVQEACYKICEKEAIAQTQETYRQTGADVDAHELVKEIVDEQAGRYGAFITNFSEGFQETEYAMYKWLAYVVVVSEIEELERGLRRSQVSALIKKAHPMREKLNEGNITQALQNAASLQVLKSIRPIIFDYDQTTRVLNVVDRSFLIWPNLNS
jgi:hypothetical protein